MTRASHSAIAQPRHRGPIAGTDSGSQRGRSVRAEKGWPRREPGPSGNYNLPEDSTPETERRNSGQRAGNRSSGTPYVPVVSVDHPGRGVETKPSVSALARWS